MFVRIIKTSIESSMDAMMLLVYAIVLTHHGTIKLCSFDLESPVHEDQYDLEWGRHAVEMKKKNPYGGINTVPIYLGE